MKNENLFEKFARRAAAMAGSPYAFLIAAGLIIVWACSGPLFGFSDTWQLLVNTSTTIITFLMVFIIQHTQNKDTTALQVKLDELIRATPKAHNVVLDLEELSEEEIEKIHKYYEGLAEEARNHLKRHKGTVDKALDQTEKPKPPTRAA